MQPKTEYARSGDLHIAYQVVGQGPLDLVYVPGWVSHVEEGRWMAQQVSEARFVELPGEDHLPWVGDQDSILDETQEFLTGDRAWSNLLARHHTVVRKELNRSRGREVDTATDRPVRSAMHVVFGRPYLHLESIFAPACIRAKSRSRAARCADRGMHALKDIPRSWQLFAATVGEG